MCEICAEKLTIDGIYKNLTKEGQRIGRILGWKAKKFRIIRRCTSLSIKIILNLSKLSNKRWLQAFIVDHFTLNLHLPLAIYQKTFLRTYSSQQRQNIHDLETRRDISSLVIPQCRKATPTYQSTCYFADQQLTVSGINRKWSKRSVCGPCFCSSLEAAANSFDSAKFRA